MTPSSPPLDDEPFLRALEAAVSDWRERFASDEDASADKAFSGSCDAFAIAVADACLRVGRSCSLGVISRSTADEDDETVDFNPYSHAVAIPETARGARSDPSIDASGFGALDSWRGSWIDEPGRQSWFFLDEHSERHAFLSAALEIVPDFGVAKDHPLDSALAVVWADFLFSALVARLAEPPVRASNRAAP